MRIAVQFRRAGEQPFSFRPRGGFVHIRIISSLTDDEEDRFAPVLLKTLADLLSQIPIAYNVRVETTRGRVHHRSRTASGASPSPLIPPGELTTAI
jgi:hypothetical protein